jgi:hypothetical protein
MGILSGINNMMKPIVFFVFFVFAIYAGFAQQFTLSGIARADAVLSRGDSTRDADGLDAVTSDSRMSLIFTGKITNSFYTAGADIGMEYINYINFYGSIWWRVSPALYLALGDCTGPIEFANCALTAWRLDKTERYTYDAGIINYHFWWGNGYPGGILNEGFGLFRGPGNFHSAGSKKPGMQISILPLTWFGIWSLDSSLYLNIFFPFIGRQSDSQQVGNRQSELDWKFIYIERTEAQLRYTIKDVGDLALTYSGNTLYGGGDASSANEFYKYAGEYGDNKDIFFQWKMNRWNCEWEFGVQYTLTPSNADMEPLKFGFGWEWGSFWGGDPLVLNTRFGLAFPVVTKKYGYLAGHKDDTRIGTDFCINILIKNFRLILPFGVGLILRDPVIDEDTDFLYAWHFSPFILKQMGNFHLYAGVRIFNGCDPKLQPGWPPIGPRPAFKDGAEVFHTEGSINATNMDQIRWSVPIVLTFSF